MGSCAQGPKGNSRDGQARNAGENRVDPQSNVALVVNTGEIGTSLLAWWLRIYLPIQGTWVQSLVRDL